MKIESILGLKAVNKARTFAKVTSKGVAFLFHLRYIFYIYSMNKKADSNSNTFLKQPYPFYYQGKSLWVICAIIFFMSWTFNYFFEPFEVYVPEHKMDFFWISFLHALVGPIVLIIFSRIVAEPNIEEHWKVKHEIILISIGLLFVGIGAFLIRDIIYDNPNNWSFQYFFEEIRNTFMVGILFVSIIVPLNFTILNSRHIKTAHLLNKNHDSFEPIINETIELQTNLKGDGFAFDVNNFLFAKAEGNYVEFYLKDEQVNRIVKRITMKDLEVALNTYPNIFKTHRSFIVNLTQINRVSGNAQGYKLYLNDVDTIVPVSRNLIQSFDAKMKHL